MEVPQTKRALRVLSVQSSVVHGYVGNKVAVPVLQNFGFDVSPINTVQFSCHTGYKSFTGETLDDKQFQELLKGLTDNQLMNFDMVVCGYVGSVSFLESLVQTVESIKKDQKDLFFACDPVMGDNGKFYTPEAFVPLYQKLLKCATLLTPNQFEAEKLSGMEIKSIADAGKVCKYFHDEGVPFVVITSMKIGDNVHAVYSVNSEPGKYYSMTFKPIDRWIAGTGDMTTSLLTCWIQKTNDIHVAIKNTMGALQDVIENTTSLKDNGELLFIEYLPQMKQPKFEVEVQTHTR